MTEPAPFATPAGLPAVADASMFQFIADSLPTSVSYFEAASRVCRFANLRYAEDNGFTRGTIVGRTVREIVGDSAWNLIEPHFAQAVEGRTVRYVREQTLPDGRTRMIEVNLLPHFDEANGESGVFVLINDVTGQWAAERAFRESEERMRKFAQASDEGILFHSQGIITDANDAMLRLTGRSLAELLGRNVLEFVPQALHPVALEHFRSDREEPYELALLRRDGHEIPIEVVGKTMPFDGRTFRMIVLRDITARKAAQRQIEFLALHDELTRLPNRGHMRRQLEQVLASARRHGVQAAVLFIDLDHFKAINDSLGHHAGDVLLSEIAARICASVRDTDLVARLGGDEFLVALTAIATEQDAAAVALKLLQAVAAEAALDEHEVTVSPSIGISMFPRDGASVDELIRHADTAMYHAKHSGRNNYQFFEPGMSQRVRESSGQGGARDERRLADAVRAAV